MRFHQAWTSAAAALCVLSGAAFADVTVSHSNDPTVMMGSQMASLLGAEHKAFDTLPDKMLTAMAVGPKVVAAAPQKAAKADKKPALQNPVLVSYSADWLMSLASIVYNWHVVTAIR